MPYLWTFSNEIYYQMFNVKTKEYANVAFCFLKRSNTQRNESSDCSEWLENRDKNGANISIEYERNDNQAMKTMSRIYWNGNGIPSIESL